MAHERPIITRQEFETISIGLLQDEDDKEMAKELLKYLEIKSQYDKINELWEIKKPY
jgi:hypothetical protein